MLAEEPPVVRLHSVTLRLLKVDWGWVLRDLESGNPDTDRYPVPASAIVWMTYLRRTATSRRTSISFGRRPSTSRWSRPLLCHSEPTTPWPDDRPVPSTPSCTGWAIPRFATHRRGRGSRDQFRSAHSGLAWLTVAPPPGLEPGMPEPKSEVLPITPWGNTAGSNYCGHDCATALRSPSGQSLGPPAT